MLLRHIIFSNKGRIINDDLFRGMFSSNEYGGLVQL